jgi:hypothetical protein
MVSKGQAGRLRPQLMRFTTVVNAETDGEFFLKD